MTDRYRALIVTVEEEMRDDDAEPLMKAIGRLRGVQGVVGVVATGEDRLDSVGHRAAARQDAIQWHVDQVKRLYDEVKPPAGNLFGPFS